MPALNYVSQTPQSVSVTYSDMPAGANVVFVNQVSGAKTPAPGSALGAGGDGSAEIPLPGLAAGQGGAFVGLDVGPQPIRGQRCAHCSEVMVQRLRIDDQRRRRQFCDVHSASLTRHPRRRRQAAHNSGQAAHH